MATNIGNLAVTLSLDAVAFAAGLGKGKKGLDAFAASMGKGLAIAGAVTAGLGAVGGVAESAFEWVKKGVDDLAEIGREAQRFGISTEKLSALQFAAGRDAEAWEHGLRHLNVSLGKAASGSDGAREELAGFGLDAKALAAMGTDKAIDVIADKFKGLTSSTARAQLAEQLFGRESAAIIPVLEKGAAGLAEADAAAKRLGFSALSKDVALALAAQQAMDGLGRAMQGVQRQFAASFSPIIASVATAATELVSSLGGGRELFDKLADGAAGFLETAVDGLEGVAVELAEIGDQIKDILHSVDDARAQGALAGSIAKGVLGLGLSYETDVLGTHGGAGSSPVSEFAKRTKADLDELKKNLHDGAAGIVQRIKDDLDKLGKGDEGPGLLDEGTIKRALELPTYGLNLFDQYAGRVENLREAFSHGAGTIDQWNTSLKVLNKELQQAELGIATKTYEQFAPPLDKLSAKQRELWREVADGVLPADRAASALAAQWKEVAGTMDHVMHPGAAAADSTEAYESILRFQDQNRQGSVEEQIKAGIQQLVQQQERMEQSNLRIAEAINRIFKAG